MSNFEKDETVTSELTPDVESRRRFFKLSGAGALGMAIAPTTGLGLLATTGEAYAANFANLGDGNGQTLVKMARDIFPHDKLPDTVYAGVIAGYDGAAAKDAGLKTLLTEGANKLNAAAAKLYGKSYAEVASEGERLVLLYAIEQTPFFQKLRGDLVFALYNNKELFSFFGYGGSSFEKGGYLERGFNDIDWL